MQTRTCPTYWVKIYLAGPIEVAKQVIRKRAKVKGMCVTIEPTTYMYSGGEEAGYVVGFIAYPRFEKFEEVIFEEAVCLAEELKRETGQDSYLIMDPSQTVWKSDRE